MLIQIATIRLSTHPSGTKQYILNLPERTAQPEVNVLLSWCDSLASLDSGFQESQVYGLSASANIHPSNIPHVLYLEDRSVEALRNGWQREIICFDTFSL